MGCCFLVAVLLSLQICAATDCPRNTYYFGFFKNETYCVKCPGGKVSNPCFHCNKDRSGMRCKAPSLRHPLPSVAPVPVSPAPTMIPTTDLWASPPTQSVQSLVGESIDPQFHYHPTIIPTGVPTSAPTTAPVIPTPSATQSPSQSPTMQPTQDSGDYPMAIAREQELLALRNKTKTALRNESMLATAIAHAKQRYQKDEKLLTQEKTLLIEAIEAETSDESLLNKRLSTATIKEGLYKDEVAAMKDQLLKNVSAATAQMKEAQAAYRSYKQKMTGFVQKTLASHAKYKHKLQSLNKEKRSVGKTTADEKKFQAKAIAETKQLSQMNKTHSEDVLELQKETNSFKEAHRSNSKLRETVAQDVVWLDAAKAHVVSYNETMHQLSDRDAQLSRSYNESLKKGAEELKAYNKEKSHADKVIKGLHKAARAQQIKTHSLMSGVSHNTAAEKAKTAAMKSESDNAVQKLKHKLQTIGHDEKKEAAYEKQKWEQESERVSGMKKKQAALSSKLKQAAAAATEAAATEKMAVQHASAKPAPSTTNLAIEMKRLKKTNKYLQARLKKNGVHSVAQMKAQLNLEAAAEASTKDQMQANVDAEVAKEVDSVKTKDATKYDHKMKLYKEKMARKVAAMKKKLKKKLSKEFKSERGA